MWILDSFSPLKVGFRFAIRYPIGFCRRRELDAIGHRDLNVSSSSARLGWTAYTSATTLRTWCTIQPNSVLKLTQTLNQILNQRYPNHKKDDMKCVCHEGTSILDGFSAIWFSFWIALNWIWNSLGLAFGLPFGSIVDYVLNNLWKIISFWNKSWGHDPL